MEYLFFIWNRHNIHLGYTMQESKLQQILVWISSIDYHEENILFAVLSDYSASEH